MRKTSLIIISLAAALCAPNAVANCCHMAGAATQGVDNHHHHITLPAPVVQAQAQPVTTVIHRGQTQVSVENGVNVYRPAPSQNYTAIARQAQWLDAQDAIQTERRAYERALAAQEARIADLEDRQGELEDELAEERARPQYPTQNGRRVYFIGDPRFAGPFGYTRSPRQEPLFVPGLGVVPPPNEISRRRIKRRRGH